MSIAACQKEKENKNTGMRKEGEEKRQATYFKEPECSPSAVVKVAARRKNGLYEKSVRGNWGSREGQQPFRPPQTRLGSHHHVEVAVDWRRILVCFD